MGSAYCVGDILCIRRYSKVSLCVCQTPYYTYGQPCKNGGAGKEERRPYGKRRGDFAGELSADGLMSEEGAGYSGEEGYSEEELAQDGQEDADAYDYEGEYADEN